MMDLIFEITSLSIAGNVTGWTGQGGDSWA